MSCCRMDDLFTFVVVVVAGLSLAPTPIPKVVVEEVPASHPPSYMISANRVLPALPLQPVLLKRRGNTASPPTCH